MIVRTVSLVVVCEFGMHPLTQEGVGSILSLAKLV